jgi:hypothetical protein
LDYSPNGYYSYGLAAQQAYTQNLNVRHFGASAAAVLIAGAECANTVSAIVSLRGLPDWIRSFEKCQITNSIVEDIQVIYINKNCIKEITPGRKEGCNC